MADPKWDFEINEIWIPPIAHHDQTARAAFKIIKDGEWQRESNSQVTIPVAELEGLAEDAQFDLILEKIRQTFTAMVAKTEKVRPIKAMQGKTFNLTDKSKDKEILKPPKEIPDDLA